VDDERSEQDMEIDTADRKWHNVTVILLLTKEFGIRVLPVPAVDERRQFDCTNCHKLLLEYDIYTVYCNAGELMPLFLQALQDDSSSRLFSRPLPLNIKDGSGDFGPHERPLRADVGCRTDTTPRNPRILKELALDYYISSNAKATVGY